MTLLITALGLTLCLCWTSALTPVTSDFTLDGMEGIWYVVAMASNSESYLKERDQWFAGLGTFTDLKDKNLLRITHNSMTPTGECFQTVSLAQPTGEPGTYVFTKNGVDHVYKIMGTVKDQYAVIYDTNTNKATGEKRSILLLYARDKNPSMDLLHEFRLYSLEQGIREENMAIVLPADVKAVSTHIIPKSK
ncbi:lipocalin-like [Periophthalmus magnuspinnatus]|uniref:lipocalin-like n=1 Tax=Periophthalmus magnuspinnatus TaxID=409849 RepID=UPI0024366668|nr:lipocalin-like [Periophthalmus magnuspinnatus]